MIISLIAAISRNNVIGRDNKLMWDMPADMKHFRDTTSDHTVIMGRKTFESIGRPLPKRMNIVITRDTSYSREGLYTVNSLEEALRLASLEQGKEFEQNQDEVEVFIIGGGEIYKQAMDKADKLYITIIDAELDGDSYFPEIDENKWKVSSREDHPADEENPMPYAFVTYIKKAA
jgi:dihydrofolate reductase